MNQSMTVNVRYVSEWDEGDVVSSAKLDLITGRVFDIKTSEEGDCYERLIGEYVTLVDDWAVELPVKQTDDGGFMVSDDDLLTRLYSIFLEAERKGQQIA